METESWVDALARRAQGETIPEIRVEAPWPEPIVYRLPRMALSLSATGSLAAACLLLVMGLHAQQAVSSSSSSAPQGDTTDSSVSVLFSPLKIDGHP